MEIKQNDLERIKDQIQQGKLTINEANVKMVLVQRVRIVRSSIPASVRKALNAAVKEGVLKHMKKDGMKPECYYHPTFEYLAIGERNKIACEGIEALRTVFVGAVERAIHDSAA
jgi:hypothetical protein